MSKNVGNPTCGADAWAPPELSIATGICCFVIAVVATIGNGLIILAVITDPLKKLRTSFNYFLINLAVADFVMGSISMPLCVYTHYLEYKVTLEPIVNNILRMSYFISGMASLMSLITLTIDRYIAISKAIKYRLYFSWKHCILITAIIWIISILFPLIYFKIGAVEYYFLFACAAILTSFVVLVIAIVQINKIFRRQRIMMTSQLPPPTSSEFQIRRLQQERRLTRTYLLVIVFFILLYLPGVVMVFVLYFWTTFDCVARHVLRDVQSILISLNSCVNPFIYMIRLKNFNHSIKILLNIKNRRRGSCVLSGGPRRTRRVGPGPSTTTTTTTSTIKMSSMDRSALGTIAESHPTATVQ